MTFQKGAFLTRSREERTGILLETGERGQDGFQCVSMKDESAGWHLRNLVLLGFPVGANVDVPHGGTQAFFQPKGWFEASRGQPLAEPVAPELGSKNEVPWSAAARCSPPFDWNREADHSKTGRRHFEILRRGSQDRCRPGFQTGWRAASSRNTPGGVPAATFLMRLLPSRAFRAIRETERLRRSVALP